MVFERVQGIFESIFGSRIEDEVLAKLFGGYNLIISLMELVCSIWMLLNITLLHFPPEGRLSEQVYLRNVIYLSCIGGYCLLGFLAHGLAGYGLLKLRRWALVPHIIGALMGTITMPCIGLGYTALVLVVCLRREFRAVLS